MARWQPNCSRSTAAQRCNVGQWYRCGTAHALAAQQTVVALACHKRRCANLSVDDIGKQIVINTDTIHSTGDRKINFASEFNSLAYLSHNKPGGALSFRTGDASIILVRKAYGTHCHD